MLGLQTYNSHLTTHGHCYTRPYTVYGLPLHHINIVIYILIIYYTLLYRNHIMVENFFLCIDDGISDNYINFTKKKKYQ